MVRDWLVHYHHEAVARTTLTFSPNSRQLTSCGTRDGRIIIWDVFDGRRLATLYDTFDEADEVTTRVAVLPDSTCAWSSDGSKIATISHKDEVEGIARIWDTRTYKQLTPISRCPGYTGPISSQNGLWWAIVSDGSVNAVGAAVGNGSAAVEPYRGISTAIGLKVCAYDPTSLRIAAAYKQGKLCVWNLRTGEELLLHTQKSQEPADSSYAKIIQFSPNGALLLSVWKATGEVGIWDAFSGEQLRSLSPDGHDGPYRATTARFSPDGRFVASGSADGVVRLWSTTDWVSVAVFAEHLKGVTRLAFSPDSRLIVSGAEDGSVHTQLARSGVKGVGSCVGMSIHVLEAFSSVVVPFPSPGDYLKLCRLLFCCFVYYLYRIVLDEHGYRALLRFEGMSDYGSGAGNRDGRWNGEDTHEPASSPYPDLRIVLLRAWRVGE